MREYIHGVITGWRVLRNNIGGVITGSVVREYIRSVITGPARRRRAVTR